MLFLFYCYVGKHEIKKNLYKGQQVNWVNKNTFIKIFLIIKDIFCYRFVISIITSSFFDLLFITNIIQILV